jgi:putative ABC transport system permease protein
VAATAGLAVLTGLVAGLYPSWRVTSFPPALALKGSFGLSPGGRKMRSVLTDIQFFASFALIISASFIYLQNEYMQHAPLGYDKDELIIANLTPALSERCDALADRLKTFAGIDDATFASILLSSRDSYGTWGRYYRDKVINFDVLPVDVSFLRVMGIEVTEGRDFREEDRQTSRGVFIFNEKARSEFGLTLDEPVIAGVQIAGFMPDVKFTSFRKEVSPMAFYVYSGEWTSPRYAYIKVKAGAGMGEAIAQVRQTLREFDAEYPFRVRFFREVLDSAYAGEQRLGSLITLFSLVAIFISIMGVFGLVVFDSEYRRREIGIRKVFGSTTGEILLTFNKSYVYMLCICFALSAPVAWYAASRWLENFAYRTPMYWWVYPAVFAAVLALTAGVVTFQNRRAACMNPVESMKSE